MIHKLNASLLLGSVLLLATFAGCKKDNTNTGDGRYNSNYPMQITSVSPAEGPIGTTLLIKGRNFPADTANLRISINNIPLQIIGVNENGEIMAAVNKKVGTGPVVVSVGQNTTTSITDFTYKYSYTVSTLASGFTFSGWTQLAVDASGNLYVPDRTIGEVRKVTPDGKVSVFASGFSKPCATGVAPNGDIYIADRGDNGRKIYKVSPDGSNMVVVIRTDTTGTNGDGTTHDSEVYSFAFDNNGGVYWSEFRGPSEGLNRLKNGVWKRIIPCSLPGSMVTDAEGNIYATHYDNQCIKKYTYNRSADTYDGGNIIAGIDKQSGWVDGPGAVAKFARPWALAIDKEGNLFHCGEGGGDPSNCVRKITNNKNWDVITVAGKGDASGYADGVGSAARFDRPTGIAIDKNSGIIYILDRQNNKIRKMIEE